MEKTPSQSIYLAGPMRGLPDLNYPEFNLRAAQWRSAGWFVINPAENPPALSRKQYHRIEIEQLLQVDGIALLSGWQQSEGTRMEVLIAQALGMSIYQADSMSPIHPSPVITNV